MVDSFTWQNVSAPKGPSSVAKRVQNKSMICFVPFWTLVFYQHYSLRTQHLCIVLVVYTHIQTEDASVGVCHIGHMGHLNKSMDYPWLHTFAFWLGACLPAAVTLVSQEIVALQ